MVKHVLDISRGLALCNRVHMHFSVPTFGLVRSKRKQLPWGREVAVVIVGRYPKGCFILWIGLASEVPQRRQEQLVDIYLVEVIR